MPTVQQFADHWGLDHSRIIQLRNDGMPMDSFEAAEAWRATRQGGVTYMQKKAMDAAINGALSGAPAQGADLPKDDLESEVEQQRQTVKIARVQYHRALRDPNRQKEAPKLYVVLNKAIDQLFKTKKELLANQLATRQLVNRQSAIERFRKVLALVISEWESSEVGLAARANPGDKAKALKAIREWRQERLRKIYAARDSAIASLTGEEMGNPLVEPTAPAPEPEAEEDDPEPEPEEPKE